MKTMTTTTESPFLMATMTLDADVLKAQWATIEAEVRAGETFEVLNRGRVAAHIVPPRPRPVVAWPDHLAVALRNDGIKGSDIVVSQRLGRP